MSNPFKPHTNALFADRNSIDHALAYAADVINGLSSTDKAAAWTGLMVVVNTAAKLWPEPPTPAADASDLSLVRADLDARLVAQADRLADLDARLEVLKDRIDAISERTTEDALDRHIENWTDTYLDDRMENWASDNLDLDIENEVRKTLRNASLSIEF